MNQPVITCPSCGNRAKPTDTYCSECGFPMGKVRAEEGSRDPLVGKTLSGGYRVVEPLAEGSMGRVYRAEQSNLGRAVAVKVMSAALVSNPEMVERFKNEARAASALNHPNCVRVYDFGQTPDGRPYFVMELLTGQDLESILAHEALQPVTRVLDIIMQILSALEEAHGLGVVHRDLKPANVFVLSQRGGGDLVKVVDFGLAKLKSAISTPGGLVFGTPEYITPEQATAKDTDERTDLYACGVILFEMVTGRLPFVSDDPQKLLEMHVYDDPPEVLALAPDRAMFGLDLVIAKALKKDPKERFQSALEFAEALREIVAHRTGDRSGSDRRSWVRTAFRACPNCGGLNPPIARFCGECGDPMDRESLTGVSVRSPQLVESGPPAAIHAAPAAKEPGASQHPPATATRESVRPELSRSAERSIHEAIKEAEAGGDAASALVFLEQVATSRMRKGEPLAAVVALKRGIDIARADLDKGELDDPIRVVAIFSTKLGEAYLETQEFSLATRVLKDALALSREGAERAKIWIFLSRVARAQGHDADATAYLEAAEREAAGHSRRASEPPQAAG